MLARISIFLFGFGLAVVGSMYIISYLNLLTIGYNFWEYVKFIIRRFECIEALIGILLILLSIYMPGGKKHELYL